MRSLLGPGRYVALALLLGAADAPPADTTPKLPVPRFVSMRHGEVNLRKGPGQRYPIAWVFTKQNLPVEVTQEFDTWRKIRDSEGAEGWVQEAALQGKRYVVVTGALRVLRGDPAAEAAPVAELEPGVLAKLDKCPPQSPDWCEIEAGGVSGWLRRAEMWGVYPQEIWPAP